MLFFVSISSGQAASNIDDYVTIETGQQDATAQEPQEEPAPAADVQGA